MKKQSHIILLLAFAILAIKSCSSEKETREKAFICPMECEGSPSDKAGTCPVCKMDLIKNSEFKKAKESAHDHISLPSEESIFTLASNWTNQDGKVIKLTDFKGKKYIVAMIFTTCEYACPRMIMDMKLVEENIPENNKDDINFLLISIDPEKDKPQKLKNYAQNMELDLSRWTLLHGEEGNIKEVASLLGFKYNKFYNGSFSHSNLMTALNTNGEIIFQQEGLELTPEKIVNAITKSL